MQPAVPPTCTPNQSLRCHIRTVARRFATPQNVNDPVAKATAALYVLVMLAIALWPQWKWLAARMQDGSDNPLGLVSMASLLGLMLMHARAALAQPANLLWLGAGCVFFIAAALSQATWPALVCALLALLALVCFWLAVRPPSLACTPILGLTVLALPLVASLQFYAGYPLRTVVAEATRWLLMPFFNVSRHGASLQINDQLILVDAACSGVQMAWWGYFTACITALLLQRPNAVFLRRLPVVGLMLLCGNIVRNTILVALQTDGRIAAPWLHEGVGLLVLLLVCLGVWRSMARNHGKHAFKVTSFLPAARWPTPIRQRIAVHLMALILALIGMTALLGQHTSAAHTTQLTSSHSSAYVEAPRDWQGMPLWPLALSAVEARFADQFPGRIERLTTGRETLIWRHVQQATRMLHPATDCFRSMGYSIRNEQLTQRPDGRVWRCFEAQLQGQRLRVCELIQDNTGKTYTDTSAWYWDALLGRSTGAWQAWTVVSPL
ncbi:exosortase Q [Lampropedia puyangensis]|uniref:exosortase Q n=1 Tax=Lampropedia puyangensis TaxID=1330072 RepID=UPI001FCE82BD|nr:exosortase Q [Lampropedia puyangensis]